jgi:hypothetical protein
MFDVIILSAVSEGGNRGRGKEEGVQFFVWNFKKGEGHKEKNKRLDSE